MYEECCFECFLVINNLTGFLQFMLGIYEIIILSKINELYNRRIYYFIFLKSTINIVYGLMLIIYNIYCFKTKNKIMKFANYYNYILGIWGFFEWVFSQNLNNYYLGILFMEFMIFQFKSSMFILELCINCYFAGIGRNEQIHNFDQNIIIINNYQNTPISLESEMQWLSNSVSITPIINITNDNISLVDVTQNTINNSEDNVQVIQNILESTHISPSVAIATPINIVVDSYKFEDIDVNNS
jgi:hypothetical protein